MFNSKKFVIFFSLLSFFNISNASNKFDDIPNEYFKNNLIISFQSDDCSYICDDFYYQIKKYESDKVNYVSFIGLKNNDFHKYLSTLNLKETDYPDFYLNNENLPLEFILNFDSRQLDSEIVGNFDLKEDSKKNQIHVKFNPKILIESKENLINYLNKTKEKNIDYDDSYDNKKIKLYLAITTPENGYFAKKGSHEGHFVKTNHKVIDFKNYESKNFSWIIDFDKSKYNYENLSYVIWIQDENGKIIQSFSKKFNRLAY